MVTPSEVDRNARDESAVVVNDRYELMSELGSGGFGTTWLALDRQQDARVAVKQLRLWERRDWKALELFEREAETLRRINHPAVPRYVEYFEARIDGVPAFFLVQELAEGKSLAQWLSDGWHPSEVEVKNVARALLEVLEHLHSSKPSVVHRDIKPENVIRNGAGQLFLIDFGSVRDATQSTQAHGSTVAGTFGYMAPEQFRGHASPVTDQYGLGATLLFLLTGKAPAELPEKQGAVDVQRAVHASAGFKRWLKRLLAPIPERRFPSAAAARRALDRIALPHIGPAVRIPLLLVAGTFVIYRFGPVVQRWNETTVVIDGEERSGDLRGPSTDHLARLASGIEGMVMSRVGQIAIEARNAYLNASNPLPVALGEKSGVVQLPPTSPPVPRQLPRAGEPYEPSPRDWGGSWRRMNFRLSDPMRAQYQWVRHTELRGEAVAHADLDGDGRADLSISIEVACRADTADWCTVREPRIERGTRAR